VTWPLTITRTEAEDLTDVLQEWRELRFYQGGSVLVIDGWRISWDAEAVTIDCIK